MNIRPAVEPLEPRLCPTHALLVSAPPALVESILDGQLLRHGFAPIPLSEFGGLNIGGYVPHQHRVESVCLVVTEPTAPDFPVGLVLRSCDYGEDWSIVEGFAGRVPHVGANVPVLFLGVDGEWET